MIRLLYIHSRFNNKKDQDIRIVNNYVIKN